MSDNIFIKKEDVGKYEKVINFPLDNEQVLSTIPTSAVKKPNNDLLLKGSTEWRWRIFNFDGKKKIEMSYYNINMKSRMYFNNNGEWVERDISEKYDKYVIDSFFYYNQK